MNLGGAMPIFTIDQLLENLATVKTVNCFSKIGELNQPISLKPSEDDSLATIKLNKISRINTGYISCGISEIDRIGEEIDVEESSAIEKWEELMFSRQLVEKYKNVEAVCDRYETIVICDYRRLWHYHKRIRKSRTRQENISKNKRMTRRRTKKVIFHKFF